MRTRYSSDVGEEVWTITTTTIITTTITTTNTTTTIRVLRSNLIKMSSDRTCPLLGADAGGGWWMELSFLKKKRKKYTRKRKRSDGCIFFSFFLSLFFAGNYHLAYLIARNSYLLDKLNLLIGILNEAVLLALWNNRTIINLINRRRGTPRKRKHAKDKFVPFNLEDVQSSFYLLIIGLLLSSIVFCEERGWLSGPARKD